MKRPQTLVGMLLAGALLWFGFALPLAFALGIHLAISRLIRKPVGEDQKELAIVFSDNLYFKGTNRFNRELEVSIPLEAIDEVKQDGPALTVHVKKDYSKERLSDLGIGYLVQLPVEFFTSSDLRKLMDTIEQARSKL